MQRPVLCRTHGVALRTEQRNDRGSLRVIGDDVEVCGLNYTGREPRKEEILDATTILALLTTVDRRYRVRVGIADDGTRVPLRKIAEPTR